MTPQDESPIACIDRGTSGRSQDPACRLPELGCSIPVLARARLSRPDAPAPSISFPWNAFPTPLHCMRPPLTPAWPRSPRRKPSLAAQARPVKVHSGLGLPGTSSCSPPCCHLIREGYVTLQLSFNFPHASVWVSKPI